MKYNTVKKQLIIPEYGRHVHCLIDQLLEIENREKRNKAAKHVIDIMGNLNPHLRNIPDFQHKLWDQLFIMSNFKLDVDSPFPKPNAQILLTKPRFMDYTKTQREYRHYGNILKRMIKVAIDWPEDNKKQILIHALANHMKKVYATWNKDGVDDQTIFKDIAYLSDGKIQIDPKGKSLISTTHFSNQNNNLESTNNNRFKKVFKKKNNR